MTTSNFTCLLLRGSALRLTFVFAALGCVPPPDELRRAEYTAAAPPGWFACEAAAGSVAGRTSQNRPAGPAAKNALTALREHPGQLHLIAAHRGVTARNAGNSAGSLKDAVAANIPLIEIDLRMNPDGKLFLFHDRKLAPGNAHVPIEWFGRAIDSLSEADLRRIELPGKRKDGILFFSEAARTLAGNVVSAFLIDLKIPPSDHAEAIGKMLEIAAEAGIENRIILQCQGLDELRSARSEHPRLPLLARLSSGAEIDPALEADPVIVQGDPEWMTPALIKKVHAARKAVIVKTLGGESDIPSHWRDAIVGGADILLTDKAEQMKMWGCAH